MLLKSRSSTRIRRRCFEGIFHGIFQVLPQLDLERVHRRPNLGDVPSTHLVGLGRHHGLVIVLHFCQDRVDALDAGQRVRHVGLERVDACAHTGYLYGVHTGVFFTLYLCKEKPHKKRIG